jgi:hypothetical protein
VTEAIPSGTGSGLRTHLQWWWHKCLLSGTPEVAVKEKPES